MSDASPTRRGCPHCHLHYVHVRGDTYRPACTCEVDAAQAERARALVETARGPLDDVLWGIRLLVEEGKAEAGA